MSHRIRSDIPVVLAVLGLPLVVPAQGDPLPAAPLRVRVRPPPGRGTQVGRAVVQARVCKGRRNNTNNRRSLKGRSGCLDKGASIYDVYRDAPKDVPEVM